MEDTHSSVKKTATEDGSSRVAFFPHVRSRRLPTRQGVFLPAAGYRWNDNLNNEGSNGNYWSSSLNPNNSNNAYNLNFNSSNWNWNNWNNRNNGQSVRAVRP